MLKVIAVDWSGRRNDAQKYIWLAEVDVHTGKVLQLQNGRDREAIAEYLINDAQRSANVIVGLDFAFSFPAWFVQAWDVADITAFWRIVDQLGESWLADAEPFWGRPGKRNALTREQSLRVTERETNPTAGISPKSVFQTGGAGAVGTGSIRGMPMLRRLRDAGFAIWPFHETQLPMVVEIYPRLLTGAVKKSDRESRKQYLHKLNHSVDAQFVELAASCEDAFDALISALRMAEDAERLVSLQQSQDAVRLLEGQIWTPEQR